MNRDYTPPRPPTSPLRDSGKNKIASPFRCPEIPTSTAREAALAGDLASYRAARREATAGGLRGCPTPIGLARSGDEGLGVVWVDCRRRACSYCRDLRDITESSALAEAFQTLGQQVYVVPATDRARSIVDYATRLGHAAVAIPTGPTEAIVLTTQPRRDAYPVADYAELVDELQHAIRDVPAYTGEEQQRRVRPNKYLRAAMDAPTNAEQEPTQDGPGRACAGDREPALVLTRRALHHAIVAGLVRDTDRAGRVRLIAWPEEDVERRLLLSLLERRVAPGRPLAVAA